MIVHRLADGKLYRLDGDVWVEVKPRVDLERLDNPAPQVNKTRMLNDRAWAPVASR